MKPLGTYQRRTALLASSVAFAALLCGVSPALAVPFLGTAGSFAVMGPSVVENTGLNTIRDDRTDFGSPGLIGGRPASALEPLSMLLFVGGLISMAGFTGVNRRVSHRFED
jgi:hypothetical protein